MTRSLRAALAALVLLSGAAAAQTLTFAVEGEQSSVDPHFQRLLVNDSFASHIFEPLVRTNGRMEYVPALAESWTLLDPNTWEFRLRRGVRFHDGSEFDAQDVVYSFERVPNVRGSPSLRTLNISPIRETIVVDPHTIRFVTNRPTPILPKMLAEVYIVSDSVRTTDPQEFNRGRAAVGTGPYRFVEWVPGDRTVLERNDAYWGEKPDFQRVVFRPVPSAAARVAAILSGSADIIENPASNDLARLRAAPGIQISTVESCRFIFLAFDTHRAPPPFVEGTDGRNPFMDRRVRRAISLGISRDLIASRIMGGLATPAGLMTSPTVFGHNPDLRPDPFDPDQARRLLREAGYPNGFRVTLHGPNDRYINDERVLQAVGQQLARIGIQVTVEAQPRAIYFSNQARYAFALSGQGCGGGEAHHGLTTLVYTPGRIPGFGGQNYGRYSNAELDALVDQIMQTTDDNARAALQRRAEALLKEDAGILPLYWEHTVWATRGNVRYTGRVDQWNVATHARIAR